MIAYNEGIIDEKKLEIIVARSGLICILMIGLMGVLTGIGLRRFCLVDECCLLFYF